jgi:hypothetical protein
MGLRAGPLSDEKVIERISTMFVPVAINLYEIRNDRGPGGDLFRSVQKQMDQYQGFWLVSPEGKALAKKHEWNEKDPARQPMELVETMDEVLNAFASLRPRQVKPSDPLPDRGTGVQRDGSVRLALYGRLMHKGQPDGPMMLDSVKLEATEWSHFAPTRPNVAEQEWTVPESVARKLARGLSPGDSGGVFRPQDFRQAKLQAKVESIDGGKARIKLWGEWQAEGLYGGEKEFPFAGAAKAEGIAIYDVPTRSMRSLLLVFSGKTWHGQRSELPEQAGRETGVVVEWALEPSLQK